MYEDIKKDECSVIRGQYGMSQPCLNSSIVVGDIILVETGQRLPADCILLEGIDVSVDESLYNNGLERLVIKSVSTGKNHRNNPDPFLLARSMVMTGTGRALVCAVGEHRQINSMEIMQSFLEEELTPMQERLEKIAATMGKWGYFAGLLIFVTQCLFYILRIMFFDASLLTSDSLLKFLDFFTTAIAIILVAIPEGLPLAVSISVSFSMDSMKDDKLLIKNTVAIETMGLVNEICTGKTATLTQNDMNVNCFYTMGNFIYNNQRGGVLTQSGLNQRVVDLIQESIIYNCDSRIEMSAEARYEPTGNGTEVGMLRFLQQSDIPVHDLLNARHKHCLVETAIPFNPTRKRQMIAYKTHKRAEYVRFIIKGAPEIVLPLCTNYLNSEGVE